MPTLKSTAAVTLAFSSIAYGAVAEKPSTLADQQSVAVTIYNENLALVKDQRRRARGRPQPPGAARGERRMRLETALLRSLSHAGALSPWSRTSTSISHAGQAARVRRPQRRIVRTHPTTGVESFETATVLAATSGVVLRIGDRIETGLPGRIVYDGVPPNLRDRPTLVTELDSARGGMQTVELLSSGGLAWKADYVAELNGADTALDLNGWVTLTNTSGTAYPNAKLQLVAGDINRVREELHHREQMATAPPKPLRPRRWRRRRCSSITSTSSRARRPSPTTRPSRSRC